MFVDFCLMFYPIGLQKPFHGVIQLFGLLDIWWNLRFIPNITWIIVTCVDFLIVYSRVLYFLVFIAEELAFDRDQDLLTGRIPRCWDAGQVAICGKCVIDWQACCRK